MGKFLTPLKVELIQHEPALWKLTEPLIYDSNSLNSLIIVPAGTITNFASVPRIPIAYMITGGIGNAAATLHDWLYTNPHYSGVGLGIVTRKQADKVLLGAAIDGMRIEGDGLGTAIYNQINYLRAKMMYLAVRLFGAGHWDN